MLKSHMSSLFSRGDAETWPLHMARVVHGMSSANLLRIVPSRSAQRTRMQESGV